jgi:hypothetical protein
MWQKYGESCKANTYEMGQGTKPNSHRHESFIYIKKLLFIFMLLILVVEIHFSIQWCVRACVLIAMSASAKTFFM